MYAFLSPNHPAFGTWLWCACTFHTVGKYLKGLFFPSIIQNLNVQQLKSWKGWRWNLNPFQGIGLHLRSSRCLRYEVPDSPTLDSLHVRSSLVFTQGWSYLTSAVKRVRDVSGKISVATVEPSNCFKSIKSDTLLERKQMTLLHQWILSQAGWCHSLHRQLEKLKMRDAFVETRNHATALILRSSVVLCLKCK